MLESLYTSEYDEPNTSILNYHKTKILIIILIKDKQLLGIANLSN